MSQIARMIKLHSISQGRAFVIGSLLLLIFGTLLPTQSHAQEIEARTYSNSPVGINFISAGVYASQGW